MSDLVTQTITLLPRYLMEFGALISGPKRFLASKDMDTEKTYTEALLFMAVSLAVIVIAQAPLLPEGTDLWREVSTRGVVMLLSISLFAVVVRLAWRMVGGKSSVRSFFIVYAYISGVTLVLFAFSSILTEGAIKLVNPDLAFKLKETGQSVFQELPVLLDHMNDPTAITILGFLLGETLVVALWGWLCWGAFRQLCEVRRWRSFFAFIIAIVLTIPLGIVVNVIAAALML